MRVRDLLLPLAYGEAKAYGILLSPPVAAAIAAWQERERPQFRLAALAMESGGLVLCGEVLSEMPNGLYGGVYAGVGADVFGGLEVVAWDEIVPLLPPPTAA